MGELFRGTSAFLAQVVALPEVLAQVLIITDGGSVKNKMLTGGFFGVKQISAYRPTAKMTNKERKQGTMHNCCVFKMLLPTCNIPGNRLRHRNGRSSGPCASV